MKGEGSRPLLYCDAWKIACLLVEARELVEK